MPAPYPNPKPPPSAAVSRPSLHLNWEEWLPILEDSDAPKAEKRKLIETLWTIVVCFVDLGWDIDQGQETSGQVTDVTDVLRRAVLNSEEQEKEDV